MNNIKVINSESLIDALNKCDNGLFGEIDSNDFEIKFTDIKPIEGYEIPLNSGTGKKFPYCCEWHKTIYESALQYFQEFPLCCQLHKKLIGKKWFNKNDYKDVAIKIVKQLSYTEYCISEFIKANDWHKKITDYIEWNYVSFGQLPDGFGTAVGLHQYLQSVRQYIMIESDVPNKKKKLLIDYIDHYYKIENEKYKPTDLNILKETYKKWLKIFPFDISYFSHLKTHFEKQFPILIGKPEVNEYTGIAKVKIHTKNSLIEVLLTITNNLLTQINSLKLYEKGLLTEPQKIKLELVLNERKMKLKQGYVNSSQREEQRYRKILKEWFNDEKKFIEEITPLLNVAQTQQTYKNEKESRIERIKAGTTIDWWANSEIGFMLYNQVNIWYQFVRQIKSGNEYKWEVSIFDRTVENCPIIIKGIIAFVLANFGKSEKEIFDNYYNLCLVRYKNVEGKKPGSSMRDIDSEFYPIHVDQEKSRIDFSQKLTPFLSNDEMKQLNQYAQSYLYYIKKTYLPQIMITNETNELSVSDWSIVFYYLFSAKVLTGVKTKQMEKFIGSNNIINPKGIRTTLASFKKEEFEIKNRINGKMNNYGELEWSDKYSPLPPERIKKILPFIKKSEIAMETAMDDIDRLTFEIEQYKEKHY